MLAINMWLHLEQERIIGFWNTAHVYSMDRYPLKTMENKMKVMKYKLLVTKFMKHFPIDQYVGGFWQKLV